MYEDETAPNKRFQNQNSHIKCVSVPHSLSIASSMKPLQNTYCRKQRSRSAQVGALESSLLHFHPLSDSNSLSRVCDVGNGISQDNRLIRCNSCLESGIILYLYVQETQSVFRLFIDNFGENTSRITYKPTTSSGELGSKDFRQWRSYSPGKALKMTSVSIPWNHRPRKNEYVSIYNEFSWKGR